TARIDAGALDAGTVAVSGNAPPGRPVGATWRSGPEDREEAREARAGPDGRYEVRFRSPAPAGVGLVRVQVGDVGVAAGFARAVAATATLEAPPRWQSGSAVPLTIRLSGSTVPLPLTVLVDGEAVAQAVARPEEATTVLVAVGPGDHALAVRPEPGTRLSSATAAVRVGHFEASLDPLASVAPGSLLHLAGTLRFEGTPLAQEVTLRLLDAKAVGHADADGRFHLTLRVPAAVPAGRANAVLEAPGGLQQDVEVLVQRPARLAIEAPAFTLNAFGSAPVEVRGEGVLRLRIDGEAVDPGTSRVATGTLLLRTVRIDAVALPTDDGLAPAAATHGILVVNPLTLLGGPTLAVTGTAMGLRARRKALEARARRHRFLEWPPRTGVRVLRPAAPPQAPCVLDPAQDDALELRVRRRGPWQVRDGRGQVLPATVAGRTITLPAARLAPGLHQLRLERGRRVLTVPVAVQPLRSALDDATRHLLLRLRGDSAFVTMRELEAALRSGGAKAGRAAEVRQAAELGLYAGPRCGRAAFHAFFEALDRAQADP
ncbi:MAG TPA: hypothetical protein VHI93_08405, partial [Candidatus Thermoplasmatota archaeon]|nr:hypothetical protein [Candidatus Thermoplasmatota archaeon]